MLRIVRRRHRALLVDRGDVVSSLPDRPGPTHDLFDVLAAAVAAFAPGPRLALLGFAAGSVVAPLRALGWTAPIEAVDRDPRGQEIFRRMAAGWAGVVHVCRADAYAWLARRRARFDAVLDDLSMPGLEGQVKPPISLDGLPDLIARRLSPRGVAVVNLLPVPGGSWREAIAAVAAPFPETIVVEGELWENRVAIAGSALPPPRAAGRRLRRALAALGSREAGRIRIRRHRAGR